MSRKFRLKRGANIGNDGGRVFGARARACVIYAMAAAAAEPSHERWHTRAHRNARTYLYGRRGTDHRANKLPSTRLKAITLQRREECALNTPLNPFYTTFFTRSTTRRPNEYTTTTTTTTSSRLHFASPARHGRGVAHIFKQANFLVFFFFLTPSAI